MLTVRLIAEWAALNCEDHTGRISNVGRVCPASAEGSTSAPFGRLGRPLSLAVPNFRVARYPAAGGTPTVCRLHGRVDSLIWPTAEEAAGLGSGRIMAPHTQRSPHHRGRSIRTISALSF